MSDDNATRTEAKKRSLHFGLRTVFVIFTLVCLCLGWFMYRVNQQRRVVAKLLKNGASFQYSPFTSLHPWGDVLPDWLRARLYGVLRYSDDLQWVTEVTVNDPKFNDEDLDVLSELPQLRYLNLMGTGVTDDGVEKLQNLTTLRALKFSGTKIADAGLPAISRLHNLRVLVLTETAVTDAGLTQLQSLSKLDELYLDGTKVTGACLHNLAAIDSLRVIHLRNTLLCGEGLTELAKMPTLEAVDATNTPISDADMIYLEQIHNATVWISGTRLSASSLRQLPPGCQGTINGTPVKTVKQAARGQ